MIEKGLELQYYLPLVFLSIASGFCVGCLLEYLFRKITFKFFKESLRYLLLWLCMPFVVLFCVAYSLGHAVNAFYGCLYYSPQRLIGRSVTWSAFYKSLFQFKGFKSNDK